MRTLSFRVLAIGLFAGSLVCAPDARASTDLIPRPFRITYYRARLEPHIVDRTISGLVVIGFVATAEHQRTIELDSGDLTIDAVKERGAPVDFDARDHRLTIRWPTPARVNHPREIEVAYHGTPRNGLQFVSERSQVYTVFSTSQWLVCIDAPSERATIHLSVVLPAGLTMVANGKEIARRPLANGSVVHEWRLDRPMPSYTFGFAAGPFTDVREHRGGQQLRYLGSGVSADELRRIFADSADMIRFFQDRAGLHYGQTVYTQALVLETIGQEMSGFSVLSEEYGRAVLGDSHVESLVAHELAHQWWGNRLTCATWAEMWLNEGFATFMAAAYMEHRFGHEQYVRIVDGWRTRYEHVRDAGHDRSLVFPDWSHPTADDRSLVYQKGAYVLHLLRQTLGERLFWAALRNYTRAHDGAPVTSREFQRSMERSSARDLSVFFNTWIY